MKTTKLISALIAIFAIAFLSTLESCTKDDDSGSTETSVTKSGLLSDGGWIMKSALFVYPAPVGEQNVFDLMDDCSKDDIVYFKSDKTISGDEGAIKCDPNDPQTTDDGTWALASNDTKLVITEDGDVTELTIKSLTSSELVIEIIEYDSTLSGNITRTIGYKH